MRLPDAWAALQRQGVADLGAAVQLYLEAFNGRDLARGTRASDRSTFKRLVRELPPRPTTLDARRWMLGQVEARTLMVSSANKYRDALRKLGGRLSRALGVPDPFHALAPLHAEEARPRALPGESPAEREAFYLCRIRPAVLAASPLWCSFIDIMRYQGLRPGEARGLEPGDVDLHGGLMRVVRQRDEKALTPGPPKHGSKRALGLDPAARPALVYALGAFGRLGRTGAAARRYLFPFYGHDLRRLGELLHQLAPDAFPRHKLGRVGGSLFHGLRHTFASDLLDTPGYAERHASAALGHKDARWTYRYAASLRGTPAPVDLAGAARSRLRTTTSGVLRTTTSGVAPVPQYLRQHARVAGRGGCEANHDPGSASSAALPFPPFPVTLAPRRRSRVPAATPPQAPPVASTPARQFTPRHSAGRR